jgi:hypothetical protein
MKYMARKTSLASGTKAAFGVSDWPGSPDSGDEKEK